MTIHHEHPFLDPHVDDVRRLRGRVGATVSLWTSGVLGAGAAGLTVSSYAVVAGEPGHFVAALDPDSDLSDRLRETGRAVVHLLAWADRDLADAFGGTAPAPGGPFRLRSFLDSPHGPRLETATTWASVRLEDGRDVGWSWMVTAAIEELRVGDADWLVHRRGRYAHAGPTRG
ncbi:flavin reductase family protein [Nocardioides terrisoli]|uniref:flavin reductase family protein n=1 Tax=Nocardioides terrisoli TaxID=3388267 RepID=UPI00287BB999|nr:flavin reductase [Nocardioides marmorisolisilvae]